MDVQEELAELRAEVARMREEQRPRMDGGLSALASHARREQADYQRIQTQGLTANTSHPIPDVAYDAANIVLQDMGLL